VTVLHEKLCTLLQEFGLPAVRVKPASAEVVEFNELFSSLINLTDPLDYRLWFVEGVLPHITRADKARWEAAFEARTPVQVHVAFESVDGRALDFEMRSSVSVGQKKVGHSIVCIFIPYRDRFFEGVCAGYLAEGRELERRRIRKELHKGVSQQLLGAAFGCKLLAGKVVTLSDSLGKEASDLAELLNEAVVELQNLVQSSENQVDG
jgi:signal transduction histidine kinase